MSSGLGPITVSQVLHRDMEVSLAQVEFGGTSLCEQLLGGHFAAIIFQQPLVPTAAPGPARLSLAERAESGFRRGPVPQRRNHEGREQLCGSTRLRR